MRKLSCRFERVTLQQEKAFVAYVAELLSVNLKLGFSHAIALIEYSILNNERLKNVTIGAI